MADDALHSGGDKVAAVTSLLRGESPETEPEAGDGSNIVAADDSKEQQTPETETQETETTWTPKSLAEALGVKTSELFDGLRIPVDGGDDITLSEFKDSGTELREVFEMREDIAQRTVDFENEQMTQRRNMQALLGKLPQNSITPELMESVQIEQQQYVREQQAALFAVRPDLKDTAKFGTTRQMMIDHLKPYGFREIEIDGIIDHRLAKYVIDNAERETRTNKLRESGELTPEPVKQRQSRATPRKPAKDKTETIVQRGRKSGRIKDKTAAVAQLLGET